MIPAILAILAAEPATARSPAIDAATLAAHPPVKTVNTPPPAQRRARPYPSCAEGCLSAIEAVTYASYLGDKAGVAGIFDMAVIEVGQQDGMFYLNSEKDYRDRNCLTVAVTPGAMRAIAGTNDLAQIRKRLNGHRVIVRGIARQVRIDFTTGGQPSGKYYYQVHVRVAEAEQVHIAT
ncbi:hypothetical protein [Novosphingobium sp. AP12]|uniref:hypothetical protein n=1 Tax=Novosphingobium sp. AP12 TaxID=1144305 RepID=UPI000271E1EC|nr:hypothetical protein [Novosphingobium sp. AP12]EJL34677.1 hypothetical protein PMI02_00582 [Novosphingobium sp. AP12]